MVTEKSDIVCDVKVLPCLERMLKLFNKKRNPKVPKQGKTMIEEKDVCQAGALIIAGIVVAA